MTDATFCTVEFCPYSRFVCIYIWFKKFDTFKNHTLDKIIYYSRYMVWCGQGMDVAHKKIVPGFKMGSDTYIYKNLYYIISVFTKILT